MRVKKVLKSDFEDKQKLFKNTGNFSFSSLLEYYIDRTLKKPFSWKEAGLKSNTATSSPCFR